MQTPWSIKKIAVLGAGVMGAQIAAHCANAGYETYLFDLTSESDKANAIVDEAIRHLSQLKPAPLATSETAAFLQAKNYDNDISDLKTCDLIIEAIAERLDWKESLYQRITPYLSKHAILVTNTSGLSIDTLSKSLPESKREHFCGVHFFNPPRYMHLAELIPAHTTSLALLDYLETWLTRYLGKGVVRAKDTPNFIANRIGVFSLLATMHHALKMGIALDEVDALTGVLLGRPKSATYRTMDIVGLDTMAHVVQTMQSQLQSDPWHSMFTLPDWLNDLIKQGHLGQKTGQGIYRKQGKTIEIYDVQNHEYRPAQGKIAPELRTLLDNTPPKDWIKRLSELEHPQAQFLLACFYDLFHYTAWHIESIAHTVREVDLAMRWGFGWQQGPFETWQISGVSAVNHQLQEAIEAGKTLSQVELPAWLADVNTFYQEEGAYAPEHGQFESFRQLPVYKRQLFPERVLNEPILQTDTLYENEGIRLWHLKDDIAGISFKTKANTISQSVLDGLDEALNIAEKQCQGIIFYQPNERDFSAGANLKEVATLIQQGQWDALETMIIQFQQMGQRLKYTFIPVVAALRGRALGGGCELLMHCDRIVAGFESYLGLVEIGAGLVPAGGGCKTLAMRAANQAKTTDLLSFITPYFKQIATAFVSGSAPDAFTHGYLQSSDIWMMHPHEVLYTALETIKTMQAQNYTPPFSKPFKVSGREGHAQLLAGLVNWLEGEFISEHDYFIADRIATILCGGEVYEETLVDEAWILQLEKEAFMTLVATEKTQARIKHLLETGKPLRN